MLHLNTYGRGPDLTLLTLAGEEGVSMMPTFTLSALGDYQITDEEGSVEGLLGRAVDLHIPLSEESSRVIRCVVTHIKEGAVFEDRIHYTLTLRPPLWRLTQSRLYQIFQEKTTIQIVEEVLDAYQIEIDNRTRTRGREKRIYCVQYGESPFDFISRLMEEVGIFYYHDDEGTVVLQDALRQGEWIEGQTLAIRRTQDATDLNDKIHVWETQYQMSPRILSLRDYEETAAPDPLYQSLPSGVEEGAQSVGVVTLYPYPYRPTLPIKEGSTDALARLHLERAEARRLVVSGVSTAIQMRPGVRFILTDHPRPELNRGYVVTQVYHQMLDQLQDEEVGFNAAWLHPQSFYRNTFEAVPDDVPYAPPLTTPKPLSHAPQTAWVVGPPEETVWCDEMGRVQVRFHWEMPVEDEEDGAGHWIRVATLSAGDGWGSLWTPRIGTEVVVSFINGDPDRPLITGSVYNSAALPPYAQDHPLRQTLKSPAGNEIYFEDGEGAQMLALQAAQDLTITVDAITVHHTDIYTLTAGQTCTIRSNGALVLESAEGITFTAPTVTVNGAFNPSGGGEEAGEEVADAEGT